MTDARLIEIFSSLQGEGPYVGYPMTFVRFQDCALSCQFCDTPASFKKHASYRVERSAYSAEFEDHSNPVSALRLSRHLTELGLDFVSLTGGEPLQQADFISEWLPTENRQRRILLETNGVLPGELKKVLSGIDVVSMDMKLPSVTGMRAYWKEHEEFLAIAVRREVYVKVVVGATTDLSELQEAVRIVAGCSRRIPFILQPVTPAYKVKQSIPESHLKRLYEMSCERLMDVRVIPQVHAQLGIL